MSSKAEAAGRAGAGGSSERQRLGAIGTLVWDTNWHPAVASAGSPLEQWGGAVYSLATLSAVCPPGWVIEPIIKVGRDLEPAARRELCGYPHLVLDRGFRPVPEANNRVELRYWDASHRDEILTGGVPSWSAAELEPIISQQSALYVNFLSGAELDLETARWLRSAFTGPIYADLHSLFLAPPDGGPRRPAPLANWQQWVACFDIVQLNETELELLTGDRDPDALLSEILGLGPKLVVVTLGARGVRYVLAAGLPSRILDWPRTACCRVPVSGHVPPPFGALNGDPTGCGDVCGAALFAGLLEELPLRETLDRAQALAAAKMRHPDTGTLRTELLRTAL